ncbi:hypothetical protein HETIRDRAFT_390466 [Heterobasidion irregulare TC 32-1]|uniref:PLAC8-domain-containing protein n=1 Tax=Heterobasidion irregulare (strain TC 32-1) TaxID=747525 RepID=W4JT50_HETIT|nr:uncharacterized protein HETIRDRAFT_390466 [Heterobasidion irregulare TC 32-1]ETW76056.1 hypothetical protein HETIRDRAFT_390466 [Heterobasidion irregulare TC 32-1]
MSYVNNQPQATTQMQVLPGGNRNASNKSYGPNGERGWSHGICSCFGDCGTCCLSFWCPCIAYSQNKHRLEHLEQHGAPHPEGGESCTGDCAIHTLLNCFGCGWVLQIGTRSDVRRRYRIRGSTCGDCCTAFWCQPCELVQDSREIELEEKSFQYKQ